MSEELVDLGRFRVTREVAAWLRAEAHTTGKTVNEIARDALHIIAVERIRQAKVLIALAASEGREGDNASLATATASRGKR